MEINRHHEGLYALPNVVAVSEKEDWVADTSGMPEKAYLYLSVAGQIFKQWSSSQLHIANVQGTDMLKDALPEALALQFLKQELEEEEALNEILEKKYNLYAKEKNNTPNREPDLLYADGIDYLEINKGATELYHLSETLGFKKCTSILSSYAQEASNKNLVFTSFFINELPSSEIDLIKEKFEKVK